MKTNKTLEPDTVQSSELVLQTFDFWFNDREHIRSPFPGYIRNELKQLATERFFNWASKLSESAKDEMNDEMIGEKFEEILFDIATQLVKTDDERLTILYPFLPRTGDKLVDAEKSSGAIVDRTLTRKGDKSFIRIKARRDDGSDWSTEIELPV